MWPFKNKNENKSLYDITLESKKKYKTLGQTYKDFKIGNRVKIICECQDCHFFDKETGVVIGVKKSDHLCIKVKFDEPRIYEPPREGDDPWEMKEFSFDAEDLLKLKSDL